MDSPIRLKSDDSSSSLSSLSDLSDLSDDSSDNEDIPAVLPPAVLATFQTDLPHQPQQPEQITRHQPVESQHKPVSPISRPVSATSTPVNLPPRSRKPNARKPAGRGRGPGRWARGTRPSDYGIGALSGPGLPSSRDDGQDVSGDDDMDDGDGMEGDGNGMEVDAYADDDNQGFAPGENSCEEDADAPTTAPSQWYSVPNSSGQVMRCAIYNHQSVPRSDGTHELSYRVFEMGGTPRWERAADLPPDLVRRYFAAKPPAWAKYNSVDQLDGDRGVIMLDGSLEQCFLASFVLNALGQKAAHVTKAKTPCWIHITAIPANILDTYMALKASPDHVAAAERPPIHVQSLNHGRGLANWLRKRPTQPWVILGHADEAAADGCLERWFRVIPNSKRSQWTLKGVPKTWKLGQHLPQSLVDNVVAYESKAAAYNKRRTWSKPKPPKQRIGGGHRWARHLQDEMKTLKKQLEMEQKEVQAANDWAQSVQKELDFQLKLRDHFQEAQQRRDVEQHEQRSHESRVRQLKKEVESLERESRRMSRDAGQMPGIGTQLWHVKNLESRVSLLESEVAHRDDTIARLSSSNKQHGDLESQVRRLLCQLADRDDTIARLSSSERQHGNTEPQVRLLQDQLAERDDTIARLSAFCGLSGAIYALKAVETVLDTGHADQADY